MKISASEQVAVWLVTLPPETKKRVRSALRGLGGSNGDVKPLVGVLSGFYRLRVGGLRVIYSQHPGRVFRLEYADTRDVVYEKFLHILHRSRH